MHADELSVMDGGKCILQLRGVRPFLSDKYDITRHPNYKYLADFNDKHTFDIKKELHLSTQLKTKDSDEFVVYEVPEDSKLIDITSSDPPPADTQNT